MQSWGTTSRFDERDTQLEPSNSGVLGLICAALGRDRAEDVSDLAQLRMGVRLDREGVPMRDYQTAGGDRDEKKKTLVTASGDKQSRTVVSRATTSLMLLSWLASNPMTERCSRLCTSLCVPPFGHWRWAARVSCRGAQSIFLTGSERCR
jgi:CRISPR-associated Cas5-like protein